MQSTKTARGLMMVPGFDAQHRQVLLLATAQALFQTASTLLLTIGALAGRQIAPTPQLATAPIASMFLGTVITTIPASLWMGRSGRRPGCVAGALFGVLGGLVGAFGILGNSLLALCGGTLLIGIYQGFAQFYRFAASEVADDAFRPHAISLVLAGGVAAAFLGPALGTAGERLLGPRFLGSFLILAAVSLAAAVLLMRLRVPMPKVEPGHEQPRPLSVIMRQPIYVVALFGSASGSGAMVLAMTATPLAMTQHHHSLTEVATVIQLHVLGMFLPSFVTGALIARFGVPRIMLGGAALLSAHVGVSLGGTGFGSYGLALVLLGIGWNFLYVGGTTLLTNAYRPAEKAQAQGANDLVIYVVGLVSSLGAGALLHAVGWRLMNATLSLWLLAVIIVVLRLRHVRRDPKRGPCSSLTSPGMEMEPRK